MEKTTEYLQNAHTNDVKWKNSLEFYRDEIMLMQQKLSEVNSKNTSKEIKIIVSHFENQFIINLDLINELKHEINLRDNAITDNIQRNPIAYEHRVIKASAINGKMEIFEKLFSEMKKSFYKFLSVVM